MPEKTKEHLALLKELLGKSIKAAEEEEGLEPSQKQGVQDKKTTLVRIDTSIYKRLQKHLEGRVPFKSASSFIGELVLNALKSESHTSTGGKKDEE